MADAEDTQEPHRATPQPEPDTPQHDRGAQRDQRDTPHDEHRAPQEERGAQPRRDAPQEERDAPQGGRGRRDRKRRRAIRAHAARAGVAYSVAARQLAGAGIGPGESMASLGRTVYPSGVPGRWSITARELRAAEVKLHDARRAARIAGGRAAHLVERFPAGESAAGSCYAGDGLEDLLAMLYLVVVREAPGLVPAALDLAWTAELGEETAVDIECAGLDRAARRVIDDGVAGLWGRVEDALRAGQDDASPAVRHDADRLTLVCRTFTTPVEGLDGVPYVLRAPWGGAGQVLDALLVVADDGHAPGTRVRLAGGERAPGTGTIVGAAWGAAGPPLRYDVRLDAEPAARTVPPEELIVLPGQETGAAALQV